jgi:hypothetical protein
MYLECYATSLPLIAHSIEIPTAGLRASSMELA